MLLALVHEFLAWTNMNYALKVKPVRTLDPRSQYLSLDLILPLTASLYTAAGV